jgi:hypothetical protein
MIPGIDHPVGCPWWNGAACLMQRLHKGTVGVCLGGMLALIVADGSQECLAYDSPMTSTAPSSQSPAGQRAAR